MICWGHPHQTEIFPSDFYLVAVPWCEEAITTNGNSARCFSRELRHVVLATSRSLHAITVTCLSNFAEFAQLISFYLDNVQKMPKRVCSIRGKLPVTVIAPSIERFTIGIAQVERTSNTDPIRRCSTPATTKNQKNKKNKKNSNVTFPRILFVAVLTSLGTFLMDEPLLASVEKTDLISVQIGQSSSLFLTFANLTRAR